MTSGNAPSEPRDMLCAVCLFHLTLPTVHVTVDGAVIQRAPGHPLVDYVTLAIDGGHQVAINETYIRLYAETLIAGTAVCIGHYHFAMGDPTNSERRW